MKKYELLVKKGDEWFEVDIIDDSVPMVFQINTLTELKDIHASFSRSIKLAKSPENCCIFDYANVELADSDYPYGAYECALYCEGLQIIPSGFKLELLSVESGYFNCQIVSNVKGIFTALGDLTMEDLGLGTIPYTRAEIQASWTGTRDYKFMLSAMHSMPEGKYGLYGRQFRADGEFNTMPFQYDAVAIYSFLPYYPLLFLVRKMLSNIGYSLETDVEGFDGYTPAWIPLADMVPGDDSFANLEKQKTHTMQPLSTEFPAYLFPYGSSAGSSFLYGELCSTRMPDPNSSEETTEGLVYIATDFVKVRVGLKTVAATTWSIRYRLRTYGVPLSLTTISRTPTADDKLEWSSVVEEVILTNTELDELGGEWVSQEVELPPGGRLYVEAILLSADSNVAYTSTFRTIFDPETNKVPAGGLIYPGKSFDFSSQLDCFKLFVQLYGLSVAVDEDTKTVKALSFKSLIDRIGTGDVVDWSDRLAIDADQKVSFKLGSYAQQNTINLAKNDITGNQEEATLTIENPNLDATKALFTLAATSSENIRTIDPFDTESSYNADVPRDQVYMDIEARYYVEETDGVRYPQTVWYTYPASGRDVNMSEVVPPFQYRAGNTHIVECAPLWYPHGDKTIYVTPTPLAPINLQTLTLPSASGDENMILAKHIPLSDFIDRYYGVLVENIMSRARLIEASFYLTPEDIQNLDLLRPVYVEKYGQYFYIQKIDNYQVNQLTKVTLARIKTD